MKKWKPETEEIIEEVKKIPNTYEDLWLAAATMAEKYGKHQDIIDYIKKNNPTSSELVRFLGHIR